ncbi:hypothetical protein EYF80_028254 [Liparis tanakae]|uniref:Uncharacterized protein n=1 Tax=Liparis tanakae TaxID=230148 RepID=A0A4Z2H6U5_9TELE|nr:hypothetical protein EYF80_028254 [Liparis tanakae]
MNAVLPLLELPDSEDPVRRLPLLLDPVTVEAPDRDVPVDADLTDPADRALLPGLDERSGRAARADLDTSVRPDRDEIPDTSVRPDLDEIPETSVRPDLDEIPETSVRPDLDEIPETSERPDLDDSSDTEDRMVLEVTSDAAVAAVRGAFCSGSSGAWIVITLERETVAKLPQIK